MGEKTTALRLLTEAYGMEMVFTRLQSVGKRDCRRHKGVSVLNGLLVAEEEFGEQLRVSVWADGEISQFDSSRKEM